MPRLGSAIPFVARGTEIARLRAALDRARNGAPAAVLVSGDAGVGKSRLLSEFTAAAQDQNTHLLLGRCVSVGENGLPYLPFKEIIEQVAVADPDAVSARAPLAGLTGHSVTVLANGDAGYNLGQFQLFDAVLAALSDLAAERCVVLALEDLHWSDASTRDLLVFLLSRLSNQRILIVGTYRSDDLHRRHPLRTLLTEAVRLPTVEHLNIAPFDAADSAVFVRALAGDDVEASIVSDVAARSEGNAFFAEELVAAGTSPDSGLPTMLADLLLARVEALSPAAQRVVGAMSVAGRQHIGHSALQAVLDIDDAELDAALREALHHHVLVMDGDAYTFRHALLREAVYNDLLPGERVRLHATFATRIRDVGGDDMAAWLSFHSLRSNDLVTALAASVRAAGHAMQVGAPSSELGHVEQALELWQGVDSPETHAGLDEFGLTRRAAYVAAAAGHPERAVSFARAATALVDQRDDSELQADIRRQLAEALLSDDEWDDADQAIADAWRLVEDSPPSRTRAWVLAVRAHNYRGTDHAYRRALAEQAAHDAQASGSASAEADALISLAYSDIQTGDVERACARLEKARERADEAGAPNVELRSRFNLVITRYEQGSLELAAEIADAAAARAVELGLTWSSYGIEIRWMLVMVQHARGSWADALAASSPPGERVSDTVTALLAASGAAVKVGLGRFDEADRELAAVRTQWHRDGQIAQLGGIAGIEMACWRGTPESATSITDEAIASMRASSSSRWPLGGIRLATLGLAAQADIATRARQRGDHDTRMAAVATGDRLADYAWQTHDHGLPRSDRLGPEGLAWVTRLRAETNRLHEKAGTQAWHDVVDAFGGYGDVYSAAIARWRLGEALIADGDRDGAATEVTVALETAERLGAEPLAGALRDLARRARLGVAGAQRPTTDLLTSREMAVLELVARGHTNRKIGEQLFISDKTVSVHVSRLLAKLDASSRTEAVALARQQGLLDERT